MAESEAICLGGLTPSWRYNDAVLQWMLLVVAVGGIASLARGRGGNAVTYGSLAVGAFVLGIIAARPFGPESVAQFVLPWAGVGVVALITRFVLGAGRPKPGGKWICPNCRLLNEASYVMCEGCATGFTE